MLSDQNLSSLKYKLELRFVALRFYYFSECVSQIRVVDTMRNLEIGFNDYTLISLINVGLQITVESGKNI